VLGASTDSVKSHEAFARKYKITFPLLADETADLCRIYGVGKTTTTGKIRARRVSFLINEQGKITKIWDPVKASEHNEQVLQYLSGKEAG
jgi:peroxiredoxin Q/BCP